MAEQERWLKPRGYPWATWVGMNVELIAVDPIRPRGENGREVDVDEKARIYSIIAFTDGAHILSAPNSQPPCQAKEG